MNCTAEKCLLALFLFVAVSLLGFFLSLFALLRVSIGAASGGFNLFYTGSVASLVYCFARQTVYLQKPYNILHYTLSSNYSIYQLPNTYTIMARRQAKSGNENRYLLLPNYSTADPILLDKSPHGELSYANSDIFMP